MKRISRLITFLMILYIISSPASASKLHQEDGIIPNQSAEYVRTLNRNASTDADAAFYNPAGLAFMNRDGLYCMFSSQTMVVNRTIENNLGQMSGAAQGGFAAAPKSYEFDWAPNPLQESSFVGKSFRGGDPDKYTLDVVAPVIPDLNIVFKHKSLAAYLSVAMLQGTPTNGIKYKDGVPSLDNGLIAIYNGYKTYISRFAKEQFPLLPSDTSLSGFTRDSCVTRKEMYLGTTIGGAYKILDWFSAALGARFIYADLQNKIEASNILFTPTTQAWIPLAVYWNTSVDPFKSGTVGVDINTRSAGYGFGFILGTDFKPMHDLNIGIRLEYYTPLIVKNKTKSFSLPLELESSGEFDIFKDGVKTAVTFPPSASIGISYNILKPLRVEVSFDYYFRKWVDYGPEVSDDTFLYDVDNANAKHRMRKDHWNNGFRTGGAVEYEVIAGLKASVGYSYYYTGYKTRYMNESTPMLDSHTIGAGATYAVMEDLEITVGGFYSICVTADVTRIDSNKALSSYAGNEVKAWMMVNQKFNEYRYAFTLGATYRLNLGSKSSGRLELQKVEEPKA